MLLVSFLYLHIILYGSSPELDISNLLIKIIVNKVFSEFLLFDYVPSYYTVASIILVGRYVTLVAFYMWLLLFKVIISSLLLLIFMFRVVNYTLSLLSAFILYDYF